MNINKLIIIIMWVFIKRFIKPHHALQTQKHICKILGLLATLMVYSWNMH